MPDNKHTNDPLERLFQKKADEYDISYRETDWEDMEKRLDRLDKQNAGMLGRYAAVAAVLLIVALLSFFIYQNYTKINELEQLLSNQPTQSIQDKDSPTVEKPNEDKSGDKITEVPSAEDPGESIASGNKTQPQVLQNENFEPPKYQDKADQVAENNFASQAKLTHLFVSEISSAENNRIALKLNDEQIKPENESIIKPVKNKKTPPPYLAALGKESVTVSSLIKKGVDGYSSFSHFTVGLVTAPDFSTVGSLSNFYTPGYRVGASIEYNWNRNFGVSIGVIYSQVNYIANGNEYKPPYGFWTNGIIPQETLADCAILVLPIHFKYNFAHLDGSRFYVTAGVSSYIMLNEAYRFNYARTDGSELIQNWSGQTGTRHWISNAILSVGYEFDLSSALSLRLEPYLSIPVRKVGWGNVKLYSIGSFISLNYHFR